MGIVVVTLFGAVLGVLLGVAISAGLYEPLTGGQAGAELESVAWSLRGGAIGGVVCGIGVGIWAVRAARSPRARSFLAATLGAVTLGMTGGLLTFFTFPPRAPRWVIPVLLVSSVGAALGAMVGRTIGDRLPPNDMVVIRESDR